MKRTGTRSRVAIGSAVVAVAGFAVGGSLSAAPESAPPSTPPGSVESVDTAGESSPTPLDPEREELADAIVAAAGDSGFPLDNECVAGLVGQLSDEDLAIVTEDIASAGEVAVATPATVTEYTVGSGPADAAAAETTVPAMEPADTATVETMTMESVVAPSELAVEIGQQMVLCAQGDADPALVAEALEVIQAHPDAPAFDLACVASVLTTFSDDTLTVIIEDAGDPVPTESAAGVDVAVATVVPGTDTATESTVETAATEPVETGLAVDDPLASIPDDALSEAFSLLICAPELLEEFDSMGADSASASAPGPVTETAPADTAGAEPPETTEG
jgi:hypothetical protein